GGARWFGGMGQRWSPGWFSRSGRPMRRLPPFRTNRRQRSARGRFAISPRRKPTPRRWSATRWMAIRNSSPLIPTTSWRHACAPSSPPGARRSRGGGPASSTRRPPIGRICGVIRRGRTPPMHTAGWPFLPPPARPRASPALPLALRRRPPEEIVSLRRPVLVFDDPVFAFAPPPPPPVIFLAPPPPEFVVLAPPPPPVALFVLPMPIYRPVPVWV